MHNPYTPARLFVLALTYLLLGGAGAAGALAQCDPLFTLSRSPAGVLCATTTVTLTARYDGDAGTARGSFRLYDSETATGYVTGTLIFPTAGKPYAAFSFSVSQATTRWVSYYDANTNCESPRMPHGIQFETPQPVPAIVVEYARVCADGVGRLQASTTATGFSFQLYKQTGSGSTLQYTFVAGNTTGYFEIVSFNPAEFEKYAFRRARVTSCATTYYYEPLYFDVVNLTAPTVMGALSVCEGNATTLTAGNASLYRHRWYNSANVLIAESNQYTVPGTLSPGSYAYSVEGVSASGCPSNRATVTVAVKQKPVDGILRVNAGTGPVSILLGQTVTVSSSGGTGTPYYWCSNNAAAGWNVFEAAYAGQSSFSYKPPTAGTYRFHLRNRADCGFCWDAGNCPPAQEIAVTVTDPPAPSAAYGNVGTATLPNANLTASSTYGAGHESWRSRLFDQGGASNWSALTNNLNQYLQLDLGAVKQVVALLTQGRHNGDQWVTSYRVAYSTDGTAWTEHPNLFSGNWDRHSVVRNEFASPIAARFVRIKPTAWYGHITLRAEVVVSAKAGETVVFTAAQPPGLTSNRWYASATDINPLHTGKTYSVALSANKTFYVSSYEAGGESSVRTAVTGRVAAGTGSQNHNYLTVNTILAEGIRTGEEVEFLAVTQRQQETTYFDGLGRPMQQVTWQGSPTRLDVVQPVLYDEQGRERFRFLPYTGGSDGWYKTDAVNRPVPATGVPTTGKVFAFYNVANNPNPETVLTPWANTPNPFAESRYEASPLNRVLEQGAPGKDWQITSTTPASNNTVKSRQGPNGLNEVRAWTYDLATGTAKSTGNYAPGQLLAGQVTDERGNIMLEYKDKTGQVVCKKVQDGLTNTTPKQPTFLETHYVYDAFGRLRMVIQPEGVANLAQVLNVAEYQITHSGTFAQQWCFAYRYDDHGRMAEKRVPGAGPVYLVYNRRDELILTQDAVQRGKTSKEWSFTKYDALGRVVLTGTCQHAAASQSAMQTAADAVATAYESRTNANEGYTVGNAFPNLGTHPHTVLAVNYYDDYNFDFSNNGDPNDRDRDYAASGLAPEPVVFYPAKGRPTGSKVRNLDDNTWLVSATFYDRDGRVIQTQAANHLAGPEGQDIVTVGYDFAGLVLRKQTEHTGRERVSVTEEFTYDHAGRLLTHHHQVDGGNKMLLKSLAYNELGQLIRKDLHARAAGGGTTPAVAAKIQNGVNAATATPPPSVTLTGSAAYQATQEILFTGEYNSNGQPLSAILTADNPGTATNPAEYLQTVNLQYNVRGWLARINDLALTDAKDLFALELRYNTGTGAQYNGNIAGQRWKTRANGTPVERGFDYTYDAVNRLTGATYTAASENYSVSGIAYSKNGNITALKQYGLYDYVKTATGQLQPKFDLVDNLSYDYAGTGNRHKKVSEVDADATTAVSANLSSKGLAGDFLDKANLATEYYYDDRNGAYGNGNLTKDENKGITSIVYNHLNLPKEIVFGSGGLNYLKYVYSAAGVKLRKEVYEGGELTTWTDYAGGFVYVDDRLQFFPTDEGRVLTPYFAANATGNFVYEYHYKDHLGNLRLAYRQPNRDVVYLATMEVLNASREEVQFDNLPATRVQDGRAQSGVASAKLDNTKPLGPFKTLKVSTGDVVKAKVWARFENTTTYTAPVLSVYLNNPANGPQGGGEAARNYSLLGVGVSFSPRGAPAAGQIKAYLRYLFFDQNYQFKSAGSVPLDATLSGQWQELRYPTDFTAPENGYLQVFVANEHNQPVWFDNLEVTYKEAMSVQENHYSPWGLNLAGIEKEGSPDHKFQYNGKEKQEELGLDWLDYGARMYDPQLGRWHAVDPMGDAMSSWSPYNYTFNNSINMVDPDGMMPGSIREERSSQMGGGLGRDSFDFTLRGPACGTCPGGDETYTLGVSIVENKDGTWQYLGGGEWRDLNQLGQMVAQGVADAKDDYEATKPAWASGWGIPESVEQQGASTGFATWSHFTKISDPWSNEQFHLRGGHGIHDNYIVFDLALLGSSGLLRQATVTQGQSLIQANRAAGNLFRDELAIALRATGRKADTEVYMWTPFGKRFIDIDVWHNGVRLGGIETKVGGSRYHPLQRIKDAWLGANGYTVHVVRKPNNW